MARGRCWPSPAPTARRPPRCSPSRSCAPPGSHRSTPATRRPRSSTRSTATLDVFVVECTSFRLAWTPTFRAEAAVWLNLAPDHLNWHSSMATYEAAKARIFANQRADDVAIGFADDPVVMRHLARRPGATRHVRARSRRLSASTARRAVLVGPGGRDLPRSARCARRLPHDITNALAASALVLESGLADVGAVATALVDVRRARRTAWNSSPTATVSRWFNDSKATTPHAASAAIRGVRPHRADRRRLRQGCRPVADGRPNPTGSRGVIAIGGTGRIGAVFAGAVDRSMRGRRRWPTPSSGRRARSPRPATPCCCRRAAPASTSTRRGFEARGDHFRRSSPHASQRGRARPPQPDTGAHDRTTHRGASRAALERRRRARSHATAESTGRRAHRPPSRSRRAARAGSTRLGTRPPRPGRRPAYYAIAGVVAVFVMLGLVMVLSASAVDRSQPRATRPYRSSASQPMWAGLGLVGLVIAAQCRTTSGAG